MNKSDNLFIIDLPDGWEDQTVYIFKGPEDGNVQHSLTLIITRKLQDDDINEFALERTDPITANLQSVEVLKDEEITLSGGNPVCEFVYRWIPSDEKVIFKKHVFVIKDNMGFDFSAAFSKKTLKTVGLQMKEIIESLLPGTYEPLTDE